MPPSPSAAAFSAARFDRDHRQSHTHTCTPEGLVSRIWVHATCALFVCLVCHAFFAEFADDHVQFSRGFGRPRFLLGGTKGNVSVCDCCVRHCVRHGVRHCVQSETRSLSLDPSRDEDIIVMPETCHLILYLKINQEALSFAVEQGTSKRVSRDQRPGHLAVCGVSSPRTSYLCSSCMLHAALLPAGRPSIDYCIHAYDTLAQGLWAEGWTIADAPTLEMRFTTCERDSVGSSSCTGYISESRYPEHRFRL